MSAGIVGKHYEYRVMRNGNLCLPDEIEDDADSFHFDSVREAKLTKRFMESDEDWIIVEVSTRIVNVATKDSLNEEKEMLNKKEGE